MHALDHLVSEALGAAVEGFDEGFCLFDFRGAGGEGAMAGLDLARMNKALPVEPESPPLFSLAKKTVSIVEAVEHAVERRNSSGPGGKDDQLQRRRDGLARRIQRQAQVGAKVVRLAGR